MSKAEDYIVNNMENGLITGWDDKNRPICQSWLTPDQARTAVEIAREEIYEWLRVNLCNYFDAPRSMFEMCLDDLKQTTKDE